MKGRKIRLNLTPQEQRSLTEALSTLADYFAKNPDAAPIRIPLQVDRKKLH